MSQNTLTPMMLQYREAKKSIPPDAVLLFRLGDFYEEFFEDAEIVSKALELTMTKRQNVPMCGFPYHALDSYLPKLVNAGIKVAIAEQMEDPKQAKGIVKREIIRIITPGTVIDHGLLNSDSNNFLTAVNCDKGGTYGLAALDVSTGEFTVCTPSNTEQIGSELSRLGVKECLISRRLFSQWQEENVLPDPDKKISWTELDDYEFDFSEAEQLLCTHFHVTTLDGFGCRNAPSAVAAAGAVLRYTTSNLRQNAGHVTDFVFRTLDNYLELDPISLRNLEVVATRFENAKRGSLLGVLDHTSTPMGGRKLRNWLLRPLNNHDAIVRRLDAVDAFLFDVLTLAELRECLGVVRDLERIVGRLNVGIATPRDLQSLSSSLSAVPGVKSLLECLDVPILTNAAKQICDFSELVSTINSALADELPSMLSDGGVIRAGYNAELDELRAAAGDGKKWLSQIQAREIERTKIKSLKVKFNSVFGYYIEVSKANLDLVPSDYIRKQTLVNAERFITPELKELESRILGAEEKARLLENRLFNELRNLTTARTEDIQRSAEALAESDALAGMAECARLHNYRRPSIFDDDRLVITGGKHPVLDATLGEGNFVPNDCVMDGDQRRMMMITGPNMAGKSTYIRQVALLVIMAQIGSFIPAESAEIGLVDRIFTRIGAADDLARGQSTFMVEMVETANILRHATKRSLVVLDEIGRGTSTFDGLSIAWSVAEYLHDEPRCRSLFATHYHELTELAQIRRGVLNYNVAVREYGKEIIFLRRIIPGTSDRSYGIHVARLAGLPEPVLERAEAILELLEKVSTGPRDAISTLPRRTVKGRRSRHNKDENDDMIQLRLL